MDDQDARPVAAVDPRWERRFRAVSAVLSVSVAAIGLVVLVGWLFDIALFKSLHTAFTTMKVNTAVLLIPLGVGLWLARSRAPRAIRAKRTLGVLVALGAAVTLAEYAFDLDLGIDQLLLRDPASSAHPGRMAPSAALTFLLLGLALVVQDRPVPPLVSRAVGLLAEISALIVLFGYLYRAPSLYAIGIYASLALHTALAFLLAGAALLLVRPTEHITRLLTSDSAAGRLLRRLLPAILLVPVSFGWVQLRGQAAGYYDGHFGVALMTLSTVVALTCVSSIIAVSLHRSELRGRELEAARQRLLEDMRDSEQRFRALVDASAQIVWSSDATGMEISDAASWCAFTGQTHGQLHAFGWLDAIHPDDRDQVISAWREAVRARVTLTNEFRVRHGSGQWRWMSMRAVPLHDPEGNLRGWVGMNTDITAQRESADAMRATQELLRIAQRVARIGTFSMDLETGVDTWTPELERMYGLPVGSFPGTQAAWEALVHPDDREHAARGVDEAFATGAPVEAEWRVRWPDGSIHWVAARFQVFQDSTGRPQRVIGINIEITERKRAEEQRERLLAEIRDLTRNLEARVEARTKELAVARDRLDGVIAMAADAIIAIDDDQRITIFNRGAEEIFGWKRDEVVGKPLDLLLPDRLRGLHHDRVVGFAGEPPSSRPMAKRGEVVGLRKSGEEFPAETAISRQETEDGTQFTVILRDITARKRLEDEQARTYAERAVLLKEIHHRVKNNLQVISSLFYLQAQRTEQDSVRKLLDESRGRLQSIALIHEKLYRSEQLAAVDFGDYLRDLTANLTSAVGVQAPHVNVRVEADQIFLDIDRAIPCALIVNELASNSMKHAFPDGRRGDIRIAVTRADSELEIDVTDTGIGFPAELDFQRVTTLGLQLVMSLTRQLRGTVELVRGDGTTFRIHVPVHRTQAARTTDRGDP